MTKVAFLFPGQGSQAVGMARDLYDSAPLARQVIDQVAALTLPDLAHVMFEGPEETLKQTQYTQPAIFAHSMALWYTLQDRALILPVMVAGHSLGEYSAMVAANIMTLETGAKLVQKRAELMQNAPKGTMAAVIGLPATEVERIVLDITQEQQGLVVVANYNTPEQTIISGDEAGVGEASKRIQALSETNKGIKVLLLPVGGAFHSPLMADAAQSFQRFCDELPFRKGTIPVITNMDGQPTTDPDFLRSIRGLHISQPVRWTTTLETMLAKGVTTFVEVGPGRVLSSMVKKLNRDAQVLSIADSDSLEQALKVLENHQVVLS